MTRTLVLDGSSIDLKSFVALSQGSMHIEVSDGVSRSLANARLTVERYAAGNAPVYGLNTGLGANLGHRLDAAEISAFQAQLLEGRMIGIGPSLSEMISRGALLARIIGVSKGGSGMSPETFQALVTLAEQGMSPVLPSIGSIGAGDLLLAAHMGGALIGHGEIWMDGEKFAAGEALAKAGMSPLILQPKDALALANHSAVSLATAAVAADQARQGLDVAMAVAAMAGEGYGMNLSIFDASLNDLRRSDGQSEAARWFRLAFKGSSLEKPASARSIQDALSFRTMASVFGSTRSELDRLTKEIENELNGIADNPVVLNPAESEANRPSADDAQSGTMVSTANFHTPAMALRLDSLAIAQAQAANSSAQRIVKLMMPNLTGLPKYLSPEGGASAGMVPLQKTVAALLAEIRLQAHPVSIDAMPVSDGVEDVAPQTMLAATKLARQGTSLAYLTAIEGLVAAQAIDLRSPETIGGIAKLVFDGIRAEVPMLEADRPLYTDVERILRILRGLSDEIATMIEES